MSDLHFCKLFLMRRLHSLLLALAVLSLSVPPAQAPTPTPRANVGYFWVGEGLASPVTTSATYPGALLGSLSCATYGGYAIAGIITVAGEDGTVGAQLKFADAASATVTTSTRYTTKTGKLTYIVLNQYYTIPDDILNTVVTAYANAAMNTEVYVDVITSPPSAVQIRYNAFISGATLATVYGYNLLCYVMPAATPTPADKSMVALTSGSQLRLDRSISYGEIAVVSAILGFILVALVYLFIRVPKLYNSK